MLQFPHAQGGPHNNTIAAVAVQLREVRSLFLVCRVRLSGLFSSVACPFSILLWCCSPRADFDQRVCVHALRFVRIVVLHFLAFPPSDAPSCRSSTSRCADHSCCCCTRAQQVATEEFTEYAKQIKKNAAQLAKVRAFHSPLEACAVHDVVFNSMAARTIPHLFATT